MEFPIILQRLQVRKFIWMLHYYDSSENIEIKHHINNHFTLVYLLWITVDTGMGEEPSTCPASLWPYQ